jgi:hypothetical protein
LRACDTTRTAQRHLRRHRTHDATGRIAKVESPGDADADFPNLVDFSPEGIDKTYDQQRDIDGGAAQSFEFRFVSDIVTVAGFSLSTYGFGINTQRCSPSI